MQKPPAVNIEKHKERCVDCEREEQPHEGLQHIGSARGLNPDNLGVGYDQGSHTAQSKCDFMPHERAGIFADELLLEGRINEL